MKVPKRNKHRLLRFVFRTICDLQPNFSGSPRLWRTWGGDAKKLGWKWGWRGVEMESSGMEMGWNGGPPEGWELPKSPVVAKDW